MKKSIYLWTILLLLSIYMLTGCSLPRSQPPASIPGVSDSLVTVVTKTNWLATASIMGVAISVFAFLNGNKMGIAGAVACFISLSMTLAVARFANYLAIGGLVISLGVSVYSIVTKNQVLKETVETVEETRKFLSTDSDRHLFGDEARDGYVKNILQHPATTKIIKKIKGKL